MDAIAPITITYLYIYIYIYACIWTCKQVHSRIRCMIYLPICYNPSLDFTIWNCLVPLMILEKIWISNNIKSIKSEDWTTKHSGITALNARCQRENICGWVICQALWVPQRNFALMVCQTWRICIIISLIARFMGPTWGSSGADRTQMGPMLAPWTCYLGCVRNYMMVPHHRCFI